MKKKLVILCAAAGMLSTPLLYSHCQMPCGIYHDDMIFDQIDQYVETMYKGITMLEENDFNTVKDRCDLVRWVCLKDHESDEIAALINTYFLQQKIKPGEPDTPKKLEAAHRLLFYLVQMKQHVDKKILQSFSEEWDKFKLMFHVAGYECRVGKMNWEKREKQIEEMKKEEAAKAAQAGQQQAPQQPASAEKANAKP